MKVKLFEVDTYDGTEEEISGDNKFDPDSEPKDVSAIDLLENKINKFLQSTKCDIKDIKYNVIPLSESSQLYTCLILYE